MVILYDGIFKKEWEENYSTHFQCIPHTLSDFQKYSIKSIVDGDHSLVMAKTGCGKTVAAEFAIQYFVNQGKQVIYTSPIKALSNQQFYNFSRKFPNISFGIFTGDIKFNPTADVIFATAEIVNNFFSMKKTDDLQFNIQMDLNKLGCLIMDEVHFFLNKERGHVWEKTILHLPEHVQMVMLSATLDNPMKFASWCEKANLSSRKVSISSMSKRIVPLIHYSFLATTESIFKKIKDKNSQHYIRNNTNKLIELKKQDSEFIDSTYNTVKAISNQLQLQNIYMKRNFVINKLLTLLKQDDLLPAILFTFSRKNVEKIAKEITVNLLENDSKIPYTIREEAFQLMRKLPNHLEYINLPEYDDLMKLLEKGIGIHHSGMIPILREIVEIFISKKYIKVLVATSSFSIGLDCAIRTTVFTSLKQYDGKNESYLLPHDYTQMSGRCGRRNIDVQGYVIHCNNLFQTPSLLEYKEILSGKLQKMESQYHISYDTILKFNHSGSYVNILDSIKRSMMSQDNDKLITFYENDLNALVEKEKSYELMIKSLTTPIDRIIEYNELQKMDQMKEKKRKEVEKNMDSIIEVYKFCLRDTKIYNDYLVLKNKLLTTQQEQDQRKNLISNQVNSITKILDNNYYIMSPKQLLTDTYIMTGLGNVARNLNEIHILFANKVCIFENFSVKEIAGLFSCFTNIRVEKSIKQNGVNEKASEKMKNVLFCIQSSLTDYETKEQEDNLETGIDYKNNLQYDIMDEVQLWTEANNEIECKAILQTIQSKGISIGDFCKAILKISAIAREYMACYAYNDNTVMPTHFYHKLSQLDSLLLKFVCTNQILYV